MSEKQGEEKCVLPGILNKVSISPAQAWGRFNGYVMRHLNVAPVLESHWVCIPHPTEVDGIQTHWHILETLWFVTSQVLTSRQQLAIKHMALQRLIPQDPSPQKLHRLAFNFFLEELVAVSLFVS